MGKNTRRDFIKIISLAPMAFLPALLKADPDEPNTHGLEKMKKIDCHIHISTDAGYLREIMDSLNMKMYTICNEALKTDRLKAQVESAIELYAGYPRYYGWCTTFGFNGMFNRDWPERVIKNLEDNFHKGATAVKIWKEVGMQLKDPSGKFIQIDDPVFEPVLGYLSDKKIPLFIHVGDPVEYWLLTGTDGKRNGWFEEGAGFRNRVGEFRG